jgi:hypothetical protein
MSTSMTSDDLILHTVTELRCSSRKMLCTCPVSCQLDNKSSDRRVSWRGASADLLNICGDGDAV